MYASPYLVYMSDFVVCHSSYEIQYGNGWKYFVIGSLELLSLELDAYIVFIRSLEDTLSMASPRKGRKKRVHGGTPASKSPQSNSPAHKRGGYHKYHTMNPQRAAAEFLRAGGKLTQQQAADRYGVPRMTMADVLIKRAARDGLTADDLDPVKPSNSPIYHRVAPLPAKKLRGSGRPPVLTKAEEAGLVNLILKHWAGNLSLNRVQLGVYVMRLLEGRKFPGDASWRLQGGPSAKWFKGFIRRHKAIISLRKGDPLAHNRREVSKQQIDSFFSVLKEAEELAQWRSTHCRSILQPR